MTSLRAAATVAGVAGRDLGPARADGRRWTSSRTTTPSAAGSPASGAERLRLLAPCDDGVRAACHEADIAIDETPVTHHGRVELPCWLREQAISRTLHRHGRVP